MKIQEATKRETLHIAAGTLAFSAVMNGVFALLGRWDLTVLWGTLLGLSLIHICAAGTKRPGPQRRKKKWRFRPYTVRIPAH